MGENGLAAAAAGKVAASLLALRPPNMPRDGGRHDRGDCATVERWADFLVGLCSTSRALVRTKYGRIRRIVRHPKSNKKTQGYSALGINDRGYTTSLCPRPTVFAARVAAAAGGDAQSSWLQFAGKQTEVALHWGIAI